MRRCLKRIRGRPRPPAGAATVRSMTFSFSSSWVMAVTVAEASPVSMASSVCDCPFLRRNAARMRARFCWRMSSVLDFVSIFAAASSLLQFHFRSSLHEGQALPAVPLTPSLVIPDRNP
jgi:hypothetical protein